MVGHWLRHRTATVSCAGTAEAEPAAPRLPSTHEPATHLRYCSLHVPLPLSARHRSARCLFHDDTVRLVHWCPGVVHGGPGWPAATQAAADAQRPGCVPKRVIQQVKRRKQQARARLRTWAGSCVTRCVALAAVTTCTHGRHASAVAVRGGCCGQCGAQWRAWNCTCNRAASPLRSAQMSTHSAALQPPQWLLGQTMVRWHDVRVC